MAETHTSVPRWAAAPPDVDTTGTAFAMVTVGKVAATVGASWKRDIEVLRAPLWYRHCSESGQALCEEFRAKIASSSVGLRVLLAGPEGAVMRLHAVALDGGALPVEIRTYATAITCRRVWCAHCGATTTAPGSTAESVLCTGCERRLEIHHHFSRRLGAYLGFMADAEEHP